MKRAALAVLALLLGAGEVTADSYDDLIRAVIRDDARALRRLLAQGNDPNSVNRRGDSLLMIAVREARPDVFKALLENRADPNYQNPLGDSALTLAALKGDRPMVEALLAAGARTNKPGWTPLGYAASEGHQDIARLLLDRGADVNAASDNGTTPLMMAARAGKVEMVKLLLARGADANRKSESRGTALGYALDAGHTEIAELLIAHGARE